MVENSVIDLSPPALYRELDPVDRALDLYLHVEPCYINISKTFKVFGSLFKEFYMARSIKEPTEMAQIFNNHMLTTFAMDACRDRDVPSLTEALAAPQLGGLVCSTAMVEGTDDVWDVKKRIARNRLLLPFPEPRAVYVQYETYNCLSALERERLAETQTLSMLCQIDVIKDDYVTIAPLFMGSLTFDHFRNDDRGLSLTEFASEWFETLPSDIGTLSDCAAPIDAGDAGDAGRDIRFAEATIEGRTLSAAILDFSGKPGGMLTVADLYAADNALVRLAGTAADLLIVRHTGPIAHDVRPALRAIAVVPFRPRRFCLMDGMTFL